MAEQIKYRVGFDVQQGGLKQVKAILKQISQMTMKDLLKIDPSASIIALREIKKQAEYVQTALKKSFNAKLNTVNIKDFNRQLRTLNGQGLSKTYQEFSKIGAQGEAAFRKLTSSALSTTQQLRQTHNILDKMATTLANTVKWQIASSAVNGLTRGVEQAWGYAKSLDTSLNNIQIVTGKSADQMSRFAEQANSASKELGKTTTDYTNAALIYAQQGLNDQEIEKRTDLTLKTANVTGQSAEAVSEQLTAVWNGYKVSANQAELYVDRLAAIAATTASDLGELSTGMSKVASAAAAMGVGEDQLAAQLSTIISVTKQAPQSVGTALRTVYARISDIQAGIEQDGTTLGNYSGKMAELGFNVLDANGKLRDMGSVIEQIGGKWDTLTREQQINLAQTMAGQRQYSNLIALFDNFDEYSKAMQTAAGAAGTLQEQQDIYMESTAAHLQQLKASVEDIQDSFFDMDSIDSIIDALSDAANLFADFIDSIGGGGQILQSLGTVAVGVFSNQIAKGIGTAVYNFDLARERAEELKDKLNFAKQDILKIPGLDELSRQLTQNQAKAIEFAKAMSPEQYEALTKLIQNFRKTSDEISTMSEKAQQFKSIVEQFIGADIAKDIFGSDVDKANAGIDQLKQQIDNVTLECEQLAEAAQKVEIKIAEISQFGALNGLKESAENTSQTYQKIDTQLEKIIEDITEMALPADGSNKALEIQESLLQKLQDDYSKAGKSAEEYKKILQDIVQMLDSATLKGGKGKQQNTTDFINNIKKQTQQIQAAMAKAGDPAKTTQLTGDQQAKLQKLRTAIVGAEVEVGELIDKLKNMNTSGAPELKQDIDQVIEAFENLDRSTVTTDEAGKKYAETLELIKQKAAELAVKIPEATRTNINEDQGLGVIKNLEQEQSLLARIQERIKSLMSSVDVARMSQQVANVVSGFGQLAMGIQQIKNLGSIWNNNDLAIGQKILQTIINVSFSLPMLANGFRKAGTALGFFNITTKAEEVAAAEAVIANEAHAVSLGAVGAAATEAGIKVKFFNAAITVSPVGLLIAALGAAAAAWGIFSERVEQARQNNIQHSKEIIEEQNKIQQQIKTHDELYASLQDLNNQYKNGQITRAELQTQIQELTSSYDSEDKVVQQLANSYGSLTTAIEKAKEADRAELLKSAKEKQKQNEIKYDQTSKQDIFGGKTIQTQGQYSDVDKKIAEALVKSDLKNVHQPEKNGSLLIDTSDSEELVRLYQVLNEQIDKMNLSSEELAKSSFYKDLTDQIKDQIAAAKQLNESIQETQNILSEQTGQEAAKSGLINFDNIDNLTDYIQQAQKLNQIMGNTQGINDSAEATNHYLKMFGGQAQAKFGPFMEFLNRIPSEIGLTKEAIQSMYQTFSDEQIDRLLEIDPKNYDTAEKLAQVLNDIARLDFSNLKELSMEQIQSMVDKASANYNAIQDAQTKLDQGKNLSSSEYKNLTEANPQLEQFFEKALNGTFKLKQSAEQFNRAVEQLKFQPFLDALNTIDNQLQNLKLPSNAENFYAADSLTDSASHMTSQNGLDQSSVQGGQVSAQLDYIQQFGQIDDHLQRSIDHWRQLNAQGELSTSIQDKIAQKVRQVSDTSEQALQKQKELTEQSDQIKEALKDALDPLDEDVDTDQFEQLVDLIKDGTVEIEDWPKGLKKTNDDIQDIAEAILRFEDAGQDVTKNFEDWKKALGKGGSGISSVMKDLRDTYADLFDIDDASLLPSDFLSDIDNLEDAKAAIEGDADAYDRLAEAMSQQMQSNIGEILRDDFGAAQSEIDAIQSKLNDLSNAMSNPQWDDSAWVSSVASTCQGVINQFIAMGMGVQQAIGAVQAMYPGLNMDVSIDSKKDQETDTQSIPYWEYTQDPESFDYTLPTITSAPTGAEAGPKSYARVNGSTHMTGKAGGVKVSTKTQQIEGVKEVTGQSVKVDKVGPAASGKTKINNSTHKGGGGGGKGKKGGGGGGGGGKGKKAKMNDSTINKTEKSTQRADPYMKVDRSLAKIQRRLKSINKEQDKAFGAQRLKALQNERKQLEKQNKTLLQKEKINQRETARIRKQGVKKYNSQFTDDGQIKGYEERFKKYQNGVNKAYKALEAARKSYDKKVTEDQKKKRKKKYDKAKKKYDKAVKKRDKYQDWVDEYNESLDLRNDIADQVAEIEERKIEIQIETFNTKIEVDLDIKEAAKTWNDFKRNVLDRTDVFKRIGIGEIKQTILDMRKAFSDFVNAYDINGTGEKGTGLFRTISDLTTHTNQVRAELNKIMAGGTSAIYGKDSAKAMEDLDKYSEELKNSLEQVADSLDEVKEGFLDVVEAIIDGYDEIIEKNQYLNELYEHNIELTKLLNGEHQYDILNKYYTQLEQNQNAVMAKMRDNLAEYEKNWKDALARGNQAEAASWENAYRSTLSNLNSLVIESIDTIKQKYENTINGIMDTLNKKMLGKGLDYFDTEWQLIQKNDDMYLDTVNTIYSIQDIQNKFQEAIDGTDNLKTQQKLKKVMDQQLANLRTKNKLTQYDVDRAEKLLQVEKARAALEQAQSNKTQMRLKRDSQGNYSYVFAADEENVNQAQQNLLSANSDLYNFDKDAYKNNLNEMLSSWKDFQSQYVSILTDASLSEDEKIERTAMLRKQYGQYINALTEENKQIRKNISQSALDSLIGFYQEDKDAFEKLSEDQRNLLEAVAEKGYQSFSDLSDIEKTTIQEQIIPYWQDGVQKMIDKMIEQGGFQKSCESAFSAVELASEDLKKEIQTMANSAGINLKSITDGTLAVDSAMVQAASNADALTTKYQEQYNAAKDLTDQILKLAAAYDREGTAAQVAYNQAASTRSQQQYITKAAVDVTTASNAQTAAQSKYDSAKSAYKSLVSKWGGTTVADITTYRNQQYQKLKNAMATAQQNMQYVAKQLEEVNKDIKNAKTKKEKQSLKNIKSQIASTASSAQKKMQTAINNMNSFLKQFASSGSADTGVVKNVKWNNAAITNAVQDIANKKSAMDAANSTLQTAIKNTKTAQGVLDTAKSTSADSYYQTYVKNNDAYVYSNAFKSAMTQYDKTEEQLRALVKQLGWTSNTDFSSEAFDSFLEKMIKAGKITSGATGMYTGEWGSQGKLAVLHEKQLVLNKEDTKNILDTVSILRSLSTSIPEAVFDKMTNLNNNYVKELATRIIKEIITNNNETTTVQGQQLEQSVTITASFPAVNTKQQIEDALTDLVNLAAQRALR